MTPEVEAAARKAWAETPLGHDALMAAVEAALRAAEARHDGGERKTTILRLFEPGAKWEEI